jgi:hypothetical protein
MTDHHHKEATFWSESLNFWARFVQTDLVKGDYTNVISDLNTIETNIKWLREHAVALETEALRNKAA